MMRKLRVLVTALIFSGLLVGHRTEAQSPADASAVQSLLDSRASAFASGNKSAFLEAIDPQAPSLRESQGSWFDRAKALPLEGLEFRQRVDRYGSRTRPRDITRYQSKVLVTTVQMRFRVPEYGESPWLDELTLTFVERDGKWFIASDSALDDLGIYSDRQPWDFGPIVKRTSDHFMMLAHPQDEEFGSKILPLAEAALAEVDRVWRTQWHKKVPIFVPASTSELERLLGATFDVDNFVAFALYSVDPERGFEFSGSRIVVNRKNFERYSPEGQRTILAHELLHVATRVSAGPFLPVWIEEGYAQIAESSGRPPTTLFDRAVIRGATSFTVPEDVEFVTGGGESIRTTYHRAASAVDFMRSEFGLDKLETLYSAIGEVRMSPGSSEYQVDTAMKQVLGISLGEFESRWQASTARRR